MRVRRKGASMDDGGRLTEAFDGAVADISVSADAMRWSPRRADTPVDAVDCSTGLREALGSRARRLVSRAVTPFAWVVADLADDARRLWRGRTPARTGQPSSYAGSRVSGEFGRRTRSART